MDLDGIEGMTNCNNTNTSEASSNQILGKNLGGRISLAHLKDSTRWYEQIVVWDKRRKGETEVSRRFYLRLEYFLSHILLLVWIRHLKPPFLLTKNKPFEIPLHWLLAENRRQAKLLRKWKFTPLRTFFTFLQPMDYEYNKVWSPCSSIAHLTGTCVDFVQLGRQENRLLLTIRWICLLGTAPLVPRFLIITTTTSIRCKTRFRMLHCGSIRLDNKLVSKTRWKMTSCLFSQPTMIWPQIALLVYDFVCAAHE